MNISKYVTILFVMIVFGFQIQAQTLDTITVSGNCGMCQSKIEEAAVNTKGVKTASWDADTKQLIYSTKGNFDPLKLHKNIASIGYDTDQVLANKKDYDELHSCCKYRPALGFDDMEAKEDTLIGYIFEKMSNLTEDPVFGANLYWLDGSLGTFTDLEGYFEIPVSESSNKLVVSYIGYENDTFFINDQRTVRLVLSEINTIQEVVIRHKKKGTSVSYLNPIKTQQITSRELLKAACCNISESFETNATVDVSSSDAVTGTKQIKMLGLAGANALFTRENMPSIRGMAALKGLQYTPGIWISGFQLNTGTGSVINGFEGITGQINMELIKPNCEDKLMLNGYVSSGGRVEGNAIFSHQFNPKVATTFMLHSSFRSKTFDNNDDNFHDAPINRMNILLNRWKFTLDNNINAQVGLKYTIQRQIGGELGIDKKRVEYQDGYWSAGNKTEIVTFWAKTGKVFKTNLPSSLGIQFNVNLHEDKSHFGNKGLNGSQNTVYANLIYQKYIYSEQHEIKTGASFISDKIDNDVLINKYDFTETVAGVFGEYAYKPSEKFSAVVGLRYDISKLFDDFVTPRLHLRYAVNENLVFRGSAGRGQRLANIFSENQGLFVNNRSWTFNQNSLEAFGFKPEVAWTYGLNMFKNFPMNNVELSFDLDLYRTDFSQKTIFDYDQEQREVYVSGIIDEAFANNAQLQITTTFWQDLELRLAYKYTDAQQTYLSGLRELPFTAKHKGFANLGYEFKNGIALDYTLQWTGEQRIPDTKNAPAQFRLDEYSKSFFRSNAQISKNWNDVFHLYVGVENLFDYTQDNPILSANNPNNEYFDASMIYAPVFGRNIYGGFRFYLK